MNVRRSAAALAAAVIVTLPAAPAALADGSSSPAKASATPSPALPTGLYGTADPTYDGVFRQSYAILAQHTAGENAAPQAISWLLGQQCANGGFAAYRSDIRKACDSKATSTSPDTNSTAAAVEAEAAAAHPGSPGAAAASKAVAWLKSVQNNDGGWSYYPGGPSDANSTGIVIGALAGTGEDPAGVRSAKDGKSPYDALVTLALPCAKGGAFGLRDFKSGKLTANADATAAGVLGGLGSGPVVGALKTSASGQSPAAGAACTDGGKATVARAARNGTAYLRTQLAHTSYLKSSLPGAADQPDYGNTADAVIALATAGEDKAARTTCQWLAGHAASWAKQSGPAAYAELILAAHAAHTDPHHFGSTDLVNALDASGPPMHATGAAVSHKSGSSGDHTTVIELVVGIVLVVLIVFGLVLGFQSRRKA